MAWNHGWERSQGCQFTSFGKRTAGCSRRPNECLILEPSEMIVIDYPDVHLMRPTSHRVPSSVAPPLPPGVPPPEHGTGIGMVENGDVRDGGRGSRYLTQEHTDLPHELQPVHTVLQRSEAFLRHGGAGDGYSHQHKRNSRASDTSSAYSGSDMMQSSIVDDQDIDVVAQETLGDSDDDDEEEGYGECSESLIVRDTVRECLEKDSAERTEDDIEILLEFMQHLPAFANMTLATRRALCAVMVFAVVEKADTVVMNDGEELDSWSVILNGHVEVTRPDGTIEHQHMGDSFGISPVMEKQYHRGVMRTKEDDCQFVCIAQSDYYRILNQGEENTRRHEDEAGAVVMVTEHRVLDAGNRKGYIVIRGTPEKLMLHLVEEHSSVDPTYVEDFLLTYRTFLKSPSDVADKLLSWFTSPTLRNKVTRVVLLWVNNHFNDFETNNTMSDFLEKFESLLEREGMVGQLRLLNIACAAKARARTVVLTRATRDEVLHFKILGGIERGTGIFISKVERASKAAEAGLKRGDQILEVNNHNFEHIAHNRALEILRGTTHLSITVKSNLLSFKEMLVTPDNSPSARRGGVKKDLLHPSDASTASHRQRLSSVDLDCDQSVQPVINSPSKHSDKSSSSAKDGKKDSGFMSQGHRTKIRKALAKFNFLPRNVNSDPNLNSLEDSNLFSRTNRKGSSSSNNSSPMHTPHLSQSASNPDLSSVGYDDMRSDYPEHVIKVFRSDQTCKYLLIHRETTSREVVMLSLKEFGMTGETSSDYCLCEVTVESDSFVKQKRLPDQMANLPERIAINGRYYIKCNASTEPLVPDELVPELIKDCQTTFLQLNSNELAAQLTLRDFQMYHDIEATEYVDDLFELDSKYGTPHLNQFSELVNKEMFWVVSEVTAEPNVVKRSKIVKHFIKIARHCKECKNFNSMFALISGLGHGSVSRLRQTWDKVPAKYIKMFEDLQDLMDPSRNMSKYRNLVNSERVQPPLIPFFPVVKKDLTFIHLGNDSKVEGLINFEKLRMIAKEVRHVGNMANAQYDFSSMFLRDSQTVFSAFAGSMSASAVATLRRKRRNSTVPNPKKMFEEAQMTRRVRAYLQNMVVIEDENKLSQFSQQCEPPQQGVGGRKRDPSPSPVLNLHTGPKFDGSTSKGSSNQQKQLPQKLLGAESPEAVRKLMSLSEKVRPHNSKAHPLPAHHSLLPPAARSPHGTRRQQPASPRHRGAAGMKPLAVNLSAESSSVVSGTGSGLRKSSTSGSVASSVSAGAGADSSNSPTNSVGSSSTSSSNPPGGTGGGTETDSGHNSVVSSNFDTHSTCSSTTSNNSPPPPLGGGGGGSGGQRRHASASSVTSTTSCGGGRERPPLPAYHEVVRNNPAYSQYLAQQQYGRVPVNAGNGHAGGGYQQQPRRPPDYHSAMSQHRRQRAGSSQVPPHHLHAPHPGAVYHTRSHSYEGVVSTGAFYQHDDDDDTVDCHEIMVDGPQICIDDDEEIVSAV